MIGYKVVTGRRGRVGSDITVLMDMKSMFTDTQALDIPLNSDIRIGIPGLRIKQEKVSFEKKIEKKMSFDPRALHVLDEI